MKIYNTLTGKKQPLKPSNHRITLYVCGITPYDTTHLGHAFTYVVFDTLRRFLKWQNYQVTYTQNVTDIDDPLFEKARELGVNWKALGDKWLDRFLKDMKLLNVLPPDHFPKVSQEIPMIIRVVKKLEEKNLAYKKAGNVYFDSKKIPDYGKLSKLSEEKMIKIAEERGGNPSDPHKKHPLDFLLWQTSKEDEPKWKSPWGKGRPGWHIECSAISIKYLGKQITIHGGGKDLIFPHHESELAQSESFTGEKPFVHRWMHIGMVGHQGKKMSKSLGNLILVDDLIKKYSPLSIRWYLLSHHYRQDWQFEEVKLKKIQADLQIILDTLKLPEKEGDRQIQKYRQQFIHHLAADLQTANALNSLFQVAKYQVKKGYNTQIFKELVTVMGLPLFSAS